METVNHGRLKYFVAILFRTAFAVCCDAQIFRSVLLMSYASRPTHKTVLFIQQTEVYRPFRGVLCAHCFRSPATRIIMGYFPIFIASLQMNSSVCFCFILIHIDMLLKRFRLISSIPCAACPLSVSETSNLPALELLLLSRCVVSISDNSVLPCLLLCNTYNIALRNLSNWFSTVVCVRPKA